MHIDHAGGPDRAYGAAAVHNGTVYPCGQVPVDRDGSTPTGLADQAALCLDNLERVLLRAGSSLDALLQMTVYLADIGELDEFNRSYRARMAGHKLPPRTTVQVAAFRGEKRIELTAIAAVDVGDGAARGG